mgnify:FL=1
MKKGKLIMSVLLLGSMVLHPFSALMPDSVPAFAVSAEEEEYYEDYDDSGESDGSDSEPAAAYYDEIQTNAVAGWPVVDPIDSEAAILMDADTGAILYAKNSDKS